MKEMRRKDREMDKQFAYSIIDKADFGSLATINEDGTPYSIPISCVRKDDSIYIHSSLQGTKIENIRRSPKISMSFVGEINIPFPNEESSTGMKPSEVFTTEFESAVVFGNANIVDDVNEKILALRLFCEKYTPENMKFFSDAIKDAINITCVIRIDIAHITGKRKKYDNDKVEMKWVGEINDVVIN